jgi:Cu/Ag efflux protein CusF
MKLSKNVAWPAAAIICGALTLTAMLPHPAAAQTHPTLSVPETEAVTAQARIAAIDAKSRKVRLVDATGHTFTVTAGPAVRLNLLRTGDRVDIKFYRAVAFAVAPPRVENGVPVNDDELKQILLQPAEAPGGVGLRMIRVSGTIVGINMAAHSLDLVNPSGGGVFTVDVTDPARIQAMGSLKVGDTVTAVISEALAVAIEPARRRWF